MSKKNRASETPTVHIIPFQGRTIQAIEHDDTALPQKPRLPQNSPRLPQNSPVCLKN